MSAGTEDPVPDIARTLVAAGFDLEGLTRQGPHSELRCGRETLLGARVSILLAITPDDAFPPGAVEDLERTAAAQSRSLVLVGKQKGGKVLSYQDLYDAVGGAVPSWRALTQSYPEALGEASKNRLPPGEEGEAWLVFERLVADGLEFIFGRRTRHLGGLRRGSALPDVIAQLPTRTLIVVDAKATKDTYEASITNLRALGEYLGLVQDRQTGGYGVSGALVVAPGFAQDANTLRDTALEFAARYGGPAAFMAAEDLAWSVEELSRRPIIRPALRWTRLLRGGLVSRSEIGREIEAVFHERIGDE